MEFILFITALILAIIFYPVGYIYVIILSIMRKSFSKFRWYTKKLALDLALTIDRTGNLVCRDICNDLLIYHEWYKFGKRQETISSVLGKNKRDQTLTKRWLKLANLLDWLDPNHCINSIDNTL